MDMPVPLFKWRVLWKYVFILNEHFLNFLIAEELFLTSYQLSQVNRILISYYSSTHFNIFIYLILINSFFSFYFYYY